MNDFSMSNPKTKLTIWIILFIIIGGTFYWFFIKPQFLQIKNLEKQITTKQQKLATLQLAREREKVLLNDNKNLQERISELQRILPTERNEFLFGEEFQTMAKLCGVTIMNLNFSSKGPKNVSAGNVPFSLSISANKIDNINYFFTHLASFPQIVYLNKMSIQKGGANVRQGQQNSSQYVLQVDGIIYLSNKK